MITKCKNCSGQLIFDPKKQMLVCDHCGGMFNPDEFEGSKTEPYVDKEAESLNDIYGIDSKELIDCYVYICNSCGGEIIVNGTEASTQCIYCGSSAVVFNRVAKHKRPHGIIPFKVTKEEAVEAVRKRFNKGFFIPKSIKQFKPDDVRGIYIPYWIVNCIHKGSVVISGEVSNGRHSKIEYYGRAGQMRLSNLPLDASRTLSDDSSSRMEPFDLNDMKEFNEKYLLGFYSNISDVTYGNLRRAADERADAYFNELAIKSVHDARKPKIHSSDQITAIDYNNMKYAMLPAWFITYTYKKRHNTVIVNGQTGKVVCGVPWNKGLFYFIQFLAGAIVSAVLFLALRNILPILFTTSTKVSTASIMLIGVFITGAMALFSYGLVRIVKIIKSINLTQAISIFNFVRKRQG